MSQGIILGLAVAAGLVCPAHMWWSHRRGRQPACCPPITNAEGEGQIEALHTRQERLGVLIAEHEAAAVGGASQPHQTAPK